MNSDWSKVKQEAGEDEGTDSWDDMQEGPSEDAELLDRLEEAVERVEIVDKRCRVEDRM